MCFLRCSYHVGFYAIPDGNLLSSYPCVCSLVFVGLVHNSFYLGTIKGLGMSIPTQLRFKISNLIL